MTLANRAASVVSSRPCPPQPINAMFGFSLGDSGFVVAAWLRDSSMNHTGNAEPAAMAVEVLRKSRREMFNGFVVMGAALQLPDVLISALYSPPFPRP